LTGCDNRAAPSALLALLRGGEPLAALALAVIVNVLWISLLGYLLVRLLAV
jgi:hypothetical protein